MDLIILLLLLQVASHSAENRMNIKSLAIVFGPNITWSQGQLSLTLAGQVNNFTEFILSHYSELFTA